MSDSKHIPSYLANNGIVPTTPMKPQNEAPDREKFEEAMRKKRTQTEKDQGGQRKQAHEETEGVKKIIDDSQKKPEIGASSSLYAPQPPKKARPKAPIEPPQAPIPSSKSPILTEEDLANLSLDDDEDDFILGLGAPNPNSTNPSEKPLKPEAPKAKDFSGLPPLERKQKPDSIKEPSKTPEAVKKPQVEPSLTEEAPHKLSEERSIEKPKDTEPEKAETFTQKPEGVKPPSTKLESLNSPDSKSGSIEKMGALDEKPSIPQPQNTDKLQDIPAKTTPSELSSKPTSSEPAQLEPEIPPSQPVNEKSETKPISPIKEQAVVAEENLDPSSLESEKLESPKQKKLENPEPQITSADTASIQEEVEPAEEPQSTPKQENLAAKQEGALQPPPPPKSLETKTKDSKKVDGVKEVKEGKTEEESPLDEPVTETGDLSQDKEKDEKEKEEDSSSPAPSFFPYPFQITSPLALTATFYTNLRADTIALFERMVSNITVLQTLSKTSETTFILGGDQFSSSIFLGSQIRIVESENARNTYNIYFTGSKEAVDTFNAKKAELEALFNTGEFNFKVHIIQGDHEDLTQKGTA